MCPDTCYEDCFFGDNGVGVWYNDTSYSKGSNYAPAVIGNVTLDFVGKALDEGAPVFAYVAPHSPHTPATPAPWYADRFPNITAPRTSSWNVSAPDHHWTVASQPYLDSDDVEWLDGIARNRLLTLLSVDDITIALHDLLKRKGALDDTYFLFTSDHGFHMGQFCLGACKRQPYDTDLRIPLLARGPGIAPGQRIQALSGIPDLAPTILDLLGVKSGRVEVDGRSLAPFLLGKGRDAASQAAFRSEYLIEYTATQENVKYQQQVGA